MLILIRGLPGSGKSTLARQMANSLATHGRTTIWRENDMFVDYDKNPQPADFANARLECFKAVHHALGIAHTVIVSNCFLSNISMDAYISVARNRNHRVLIITCRGQYGSSHNIPADVLQSMRDKWEELPSK